MRGQQSNYDLRGSRNPGVEQIIVDRGLSFPVRNIYSSSMLGGSNSRDFHESASKGLIRYTHEHTKCLTLQPFAASMIFLPCCTCRFPHSADGSQSGNRDKMSIVVSIMVIEQPLLLTVRHAEDRIHASEGG